MAWPKSFRKLSNFSSWPANYRFAYVLVIAGIFVCLGVLVFGNQPAEAANSPNAAEPAVNSEMCEEPENR